MPSETAPVSAPVNAPASPVEYPQAAPKISKDGKPSQAAAKGLKAAAAMLAKADAKEKEAASIVLRAPVFPSAPVFARMQAAAKKAAAAPLAAPVSLRSLFESSGGKLDAVREVLQLDEQQKAQWKPLAAALAAAHTQWVRANKSRILSAVSRIARSSDATLAGGFRKNSEGKVISARISARL
jgi:hypothetical protein